MSKKKSAAAPAATPDVHPPVEPTATPQEPSASDTPPAERVLAGEFSAAGFAPEPAFATTFTQKDRLLRGDFYILRDLQRQMKPAWFTLGPGDVEITITLKR